MNTALGRPAREGEVPKFGSVWRWKETPGRLVSIGLLESAGNGYTLFLVALRCDTRKIEKAMIWGHKTLGRIVPAEGWYCVADGPDV